METTILYSKQERLGTIAARKPEYHVCRPYRIMEKKMETIGIIGLKLGLYWGYMGIMEKGMETTIIY